jgi:hypothetical protein
MSNPELDRMSTEALRQVRDELKRRRAAKVKATRPLPLYPDVTTEDVIKIIGEVEDQLLTLRTMLGQWLLNMDAVGAERMARGDLQSRAIGE